MVVNHQSVNEWVPGFMIQVYMSHINMYISLRHTVAPNSPQLAVEGNVCYFSEPLSLSSKTYFERCSFWLPCSKPMLVILGDYTNQLFFTFFGDHHNPSADFYKPTGIAKLQRVLITARCPTTGMTIPIESLRRWLNQMMSDFG